MGKGQSQSSGNQFQSQNSASSRFTTSTSPFSAGINQEGFNLSLLGGSTLSKLLGSINSALGGKFTQIPLIQAATSSALGATNNAYQSALSSFAGAGFGADPLSQGVLGNIKMQGAEATSQIPSQIAQWLIGMAPGLINTSLGTGAGLQLGAQGANINTTSQSFGRNVTRGSSSSGGTNGLDPSLLINSLFQTGIAAGIFGA